MSKHSSHPIIKQLRRARCAQALTADELAAKIGCPTSSIWKWESGTSCPLFLNLEAWANALGYDITLTPRFASDAQETQDTQSDNRVPVQG